MGPSCVFCSVVNHRSADKMSQRLWKVNTAQRARRLWPSSEIRRWRQRLHRPRAS
jgi:hypothetical protein